MKLTIDTNGHNLPPSFRSDISHLFDEGAISVADVDDCSDEHETCYTVEVALNGVACTIKASYSFWGGYVRLTDGDENIVSEFIA